jgi:membrane protein implicated in regulation of membrane protease activity
MIDAFTGIWWVWIAAALVFGLIEVLAPGFIFLGFALGALATGLLVGLGYAPSASLLLAVFGGVSILAWVGLKLAFRRQSSGRKIITEDINDS